MSFEDGDVLIVGSRFWIRTGGRWIATTFTKQAPYEFGDQTAQTLIETDHAELRS